MSQSVKADLVVALSRTTTPETIQFSDSDVKNLVSSVNSDWVRHGAALSPIVTNQQTSMTMNAIADFEADRYGPAEWANGRAAFAVYAGATLQLTLCGKWPRSPLLL